jgi:hypothetical protein
MFKKIYNFFDKLEDSIRLVLSHHPLIYTFIGATAIVLFWRGVWHTADALALQGGVLGFLFYEPVNLVIVVLVLLVTGLFVSYFIGDAVLISGLTGQKKLTEKTEKEISLEEHQLVELREEVKDIKKEIDEIRDAVVK